MKNYPGVSRFVVRYVPRRGPDKGRKCIYTYYKARIWVDGKNKFIGNYVTAEEAAMAYEKEKAKFK